MNATLELPASMPPVNGHHRPLELAAPQPAPAPSPQPPELLQLPILDRAIPSPRDREIFRQVVICCRTKTDVARQFQLSQPRISQICGAVKEWMKEHTQSHAEETTQPQQLNLAENLCRERLEVQYALAMEAYEASREPRQWDGWDCEGNRTEKSPRGDQQPKCAFLNTALKATIELARLDGIWGSGDAWAGRNRAKLDEFQQQRDSQWQAESAEHEALLADMRAINAQRRSPAAIESPPAATYERLWNLPPVAAPAAEVAAAAGDASRAASDVCSDGSARNLAVDHVADRLKSAYARQDELAPSSAALPSDRLPPAHREKTFRRQRQRQEFLAPLARLTPQSPPIPDRINGHAQSGP